MRSNCKGYVYYRENKGLDFSKMLYRNYGPNEEQSPGICYYNPNYEVIMNKSPRVLFDIKKNRSSPRYRIQKLWRSYNVSSEYQLVKELN